jgi:hypothetical protein
MWSRVSSEHSGQSSGDPYTSETTSILRQNYDPTNSIYKIWYGIGEEKLKVRLNDGTIMAVTLSADAAYYES